MPPSAPAGAELFEPRERRLAEGAWLLPGFALAEAEAFVATAEAVAAVSPFRHMTTRSGLVMSVAMTSCGAAGWVSDRRGYRYDEADTQTGHPWPPMPPAFAGLAARAAARGGFEGFAPDTCLINRYRPGDRLALHQDRDERSYEQPIVSVSLGLDATFLFGGDTRGERTVRIGLAHGDVLVWGGRARLAHHGVLALKEGTHPMLGRQRINLTFRRALS